MRFIAVAMVACALVAASVSAVPVSKARAMALNGALNGPHKLNPAPKAPVLPSSFTGTYSIFALNVESPIVPSAISGWLNGASKLFDGQVWQNIDNSGVVTIKTITTPTMIGNLLTHAMTQTWVGNHGWTETNGQCKADTTNSQLVIPGDVLVKSGKYVQTLDVAPIEHGSKLKQTTCDEWDATLPNGEGTVTYWLVSGTTTPFVSHYKLTGKPPVWVQYGTITPGVNAAGIYAADKACAQVAAAAAAANTHAATAVSAAPAPAPKKKF